MVPTRGDDAGPRLQGEATEMIAWEPRATSGSGPAIVTAPVLGRAELPPQVQQHIALTLHKNPDKPVEIALNPPELGRVRMMMMASETGMVVQVLTDRSDTLDLMRRNIDDLGRALADLGYEDISFAFGQGQDGGEADTAPHDHTEGGTRGPEGPVTDLTHQTQRHVPQLNIAPDSIDIRL